MALPLKHDQLQAERHARRACLSFFIDRHSRLYELETYASRMATETELKLWRLKIPAKIHSPSLASLPVFNVIPQEIESILMNTSISIHPTDFSEFKKFIEFDKNQNIKELRSNLLAHFKNQALFVTQFIPHGYYWRGEFKRDRNNINLTAISSELIPFMCH